MKLNINTVNASRILESFHYIFFQCVLRKNVLLGGDFFAVYEPRRRTRSLHFSSTCARASEIGKCTEGCAIGHSIVAKNVAER